MVDDGRLPRPPVLTLGKLPTTTEDPVQKITYVGPFSEVEFEQGAVWRTAKAGETVDVPDALAESLLEQTDNWQKTTKTATKKAQPGEED